MYLTWDGSAMHISQEIVSTECYGGQMRVMHAVAREGVEREAHTIKRAPSSRPLSLAGEVSMTAFRPPEMWSERAKGSAELRAQNGKAARERTLMG